MFSSLTFPVEARVPQLLGLCGGFCPPDLDQVVVVPLLVLLNYEGFVLFVFSLFYDRKTPSEVLEEEWCSTSAVGDSVGRSSTF